MTDQPIYCQHPAEVFDIVQTRRTVNHLRAVLRVAKDDRRHAEGHEADAREALRAAVRAHEAAIARYDEADQTARGLVGLVDPAHEL